MSEVAPIRHKYRCPPRRLPNTPELVPLFTHQVGLTALTSVLNPKDKESQGVASQWAEPGEVSHSAWSVPLFSMGPLGRG